MRSLSHVTWFSVAACVFAVAACSSGNSSSGTNDTAAVTPSISGTVSAVVGAGSHAFSLTFNSSDGRPLSSLQVTSGLAALPSGWSGPASFSCATASVGSGCLLNLTYAPTTAGSGTLTLHYSYQNDAGMNQSASIVIPYSASAGNNVIATASSSGQINAVAGAGAQAVGVTFTTDNGMAATGLTLTTDLASLPAGWSSTDHAFACTSVSTGNGCHLPLTYQPTAAGHGTLTLAYSYVNDGGSSKTGSMNIAYAATTNNSVVATASPTGQIAAVVGSGAQAVDVTFTTDDGNAASALSLTTDLSSLPSGWSSTTQNFACGAVSTGNGCQLALLFQPSMAQSGTLTLSYSYANDAGMTKTGTLNIPYAATAHDNVRGAMTPTGQISVVVGGSQSATVTFTTDDGNTATAFTLTTVLSSLPAGWSSTASTLTCAGVSTGSACQLPLTFAPTTQTSGTLSLNYAYADDAGTPKTGTVSIPYAATVHDNAVATVSPSGTVALTVNGSTEVTVTFTTDDGNTASGLSVTSGLSSLPSGWSGPSGFSCTSFAAGTSCQLGLMYAPTAAANGTVQLTYDYLDDAGASKTGTVGIAYSAVNQHFYVADAQLGLYVCAMNGDGTLSNCTSTGGLSEAEGIAFSGNYAYVSLFNSNAVKVCTVASDGTLSGCTSTGSGFDSPVQMSIVGSAFYVADANNPGQIVSCSISSADGTLFNCSLTASATSANMAGVWVGPAYAYLTGYGGNVYVCDVASAGVLNNCATTASALNGGAFNVATGNGYAYIATFAGVGGCEIANDGTLSSCINASVNGESARAVTLSNGNLYVGINAYDANNGSAIEDVYVCAANGVNVTNCVLSDGGMTFQNVFGVAVH